MSPSNTLSPVAVRVARSFGADGLAEAWNEAIALSPSHTVFQTRAWLQAWWETFGRGELMLLVATKAGRTVALAPWFAEAGMVFPIGSGGSDYLDLLGNVTDPEVLDGLLSAARDRCPGFVGYRFYHLPDDSPTGSLLASAAERLGLAIFDEGEQVAPVVDLAADPEHAFAATRKKSLVRHENWFRRHGELAVRHTSEASVTIPDLRQFFEQHVARWSVTPYPSLFQDDQQRTFYRRVCELAGPEGWLRFTRVMWAGRPIAFHFGFCYRGAYLWYKPTFDLALAARSPGEVLLRQLLLAAIEEGAETFDFGLGDEAFKSRFASSQRTVRDWGLYPRDSL